MGLYLVYGVEGADGPVDDTSGWTASNTGWGAFGDWAAGLPAGEYPELTYLAEYGEVFAEDGSAAAVEALAGELARALGEKPGDPTPEVLGVGKLLLQALRRRPADAVAAVITDGTSGDEGDEDDDDDLEDDGDDGLDDSGPPGEEGDEEDTYRSVEAGAKGVGCACGPGCSCTGCKALHGPACPCAACREARGEHPCDRVAPEDRRECRDLWDEYEKVEGQLSLVRDALGVAEGIGSVRKALSSLGEMAGGALTAPAGQGDEEQEEELAARRDRLEARSLELWDRLLRLGVEALWGPRERGGGGG
jgi:hypothetical protein